MCPWHDTLSASYVRPSGRQKTWTGCTHTDMVVYELKSRPLGVRPELLPGSAVMIANALAEQPDQGPVAHRGDLDLCRHTVRRVESLNALDILTADWWERPRSARAQPLAGGPGGRVDGSCDAVDHLIDREDRLKLVRSSLPCPATGMGRSIIAFPLASSQSCQDEKNLEPSCAHCNRAPKQAEAEDEEHQT